MNIDQPDAVVVPGQRALLEVAGHQGEHDGVTQATVKTLNKILCVDLHMVLIYFYLSMTLGIDHFENCEASIARGTRGMAMKMARLML